MTLALWALATRNGVDSLLHQRTVALDNWLRQTGAKLNAIEQLPMRLLAGAEQPLSRAGLEKLRTQAAPYFAIYPLGEGPSWLGPLVQERLRADQFSVRPLPPGLEAGLVTRPLPPGLPRNYWVTGLRMRDGSWLLASLETDYLFGSWLAGQLQSCPDTRRWDGRTPGPTRELPTFFGNDPYPFESVVVQMDNRPSLRGYLLGQSLLLLGALLMLATFALSIRWAARGLRREWDFVQARKHFNALVSHELRTPIAAIRMYTEILQNGWIEDPQKVASYHHIIGSESARLGHLVENLLGVGTLEEGSHPFARSPFPLQSLLEELLQREGWTVAQEIPTDLPMLLGDREAMQLVLGNLISNALKYGGAEVLVRAMSTETGVVIEVLDRGPGIPSDQRQRIFQAYQRLAGAETRGVGLGLALVKGFVEGQGGRVSIADREGGGTNFRVELPRA